MQKFSTEIETEDKEKKVITVWLDDETAWLLNECGDEALKHAYIVEEYQSQLIERKETRRHQSLEEMIGLGIEIADERADTERCYERNEEYAQLHKALRRYDNDEKERKENGEESRNDSRKSRRHHARRRVDRRAYCRECGRHACVRHYKGVGYGTQREYARTRKKAHL